MGGPLLAGALLGAPPRAACIAHPKPPAALAPAPTGAVAALQAAAAAVGEAVATALRAAYLVLLFLPAVLSAPVLPAFGGPARAAWVDLVRWTLERAGPAFIKWGQWAATRQDLFPADVCAALGCLHSAAPAHGFAHTRATVEAAFGRRLEELFDEFDAAPVASGSVAQVHRAVLSAAAAAGTGVPPGTVVAVKVRHPGVDAMMQRDFGLMMAAATASRHVPGLGELRLDESVRPFGAPLREQLDLATEAANLARFNHNFRRWRRVSFPRPVQPLVTPDVLVESFEEGRPISAFVDGDAAGSPVAAGLAGLGLDCYLKMLLRDNFIHADLHPGNMLVRPAPDPGTSLLARAAAWVRGTAAPHLVMLDVGMIAELTPGDQANLVSFFKALTRLDGEALGRNILAFADDQTCPRPAAFVAQMKGLFDGLTPQEIQERTSKVFQDMMTLVRENDVALKGVVSTVVVTTLVLEGWSTKLDPDIRILCTLKNLLPQEWRERAGRLVEALTSADVPAAA